MRKRGREKNIPRKGRHRTERGRRGRKRQGSGRQQESEAGRERKSKKGRKERREQGGLEGIRKVRKGGKAREKGWKKRERETR